MASARNPTFKQAFCQYYHCAPEDYLKEALFRTLHLHAIPIVSLFSLRRSASLALAFDALAQAGEAENPIEIYQALADYRYRLRISRISPFVALLRLRISGKRLIDLFSKVYPAKATTSAPVATASRCD